MMTTTRRMMLLGAVALVAAPPVLAAPEAEVQQIEASVVQAQIDAGEVALVDVRTPQEWAQSGIAEGAVPIAMQDPELGDKLAALLEDDPTKPIALICATGVRSQAVADAMLRHGFTNVYNVKGGMFGSIHGPGWIKSDLPVVPVSQ